jgi:hypothetical protein
MQKTTFYICLFVLLTPVLSSCGTYVPDLQGGLIPNKEAEAVLVSNLVQHVECEVIAGVQEVLLNDEDNGAVQRSYGLPEKRNLDWLRKWAAQITLTLTVEEKTSLNPSATFNKLFPTAQTFPNSALPVKTEQIGSLVLAGAYSSDATRKDTLSLYLDFSTFSNEKALILARQARDRGNWPPCDSASGVFMSGDLKFKNWLQQSTLLANVKGGIGGDYAQSLSQEESASKKDVLSHEVTFVIIYGANATPSWKFVNISANQGSLPFVSAQRTNTQDVIITLGPAQGDTLSLAASNTILASQIGIAVGNAIRNSQ